jgi:hypothetical protein
VRIREMGDTTPFVDNHVQAVKQRAEGRVHAYFFHDFTNSREQTRVV